ncbi:unnamed protein product [Brachionus calyciflorus]|uniref:Uncharacterized protein n=1 Tax=Brachionus calyciflorus TaxID=104777 RepID=A0A813WWH5_9BILA|nr:unnamed protein product [Brachionus calyciflorus]
MIGNLIPSNNVWALRDKDRMKTDFNDEIHAAFGYVSEKRPTLYFGAAEGEVRKLCNEARAYKVVKNPNNSNEHNCDENEHINDLVAESLNDSKNQSDKGENDSTCFEQVSFNYSNDGESTNDLLIEKAQNRQSFENHSFYGSSSKKSEDGDTKEQTNFKRKLKSSRYLLEDSE